MGTSSSKVDLQATATHPVAVIEDHADFRRIIAGGNWVVIDFWAHNCGPCRQIAPIFEKHSRTFPHADFYKVNVDEHPRIADDAKIRTTPTIVVFNDGKKKAQLKGADPHGLKTLLEKYTGQSTA